MSINVSMQEALGRFSASSFETNKGIALQLLPYSSVDDCSVWRLTVDENDFLFSDESKKWSCLFGDLVWYFSCETLADVKELAEAFFTPAIYNAEHGGFASALYECSHFTIFFTKDGFEGRDLKYFSN